MKDWGPLVLAEISADTRLEVERLEARLSDVRAILSSGGDAQSELEELHSDVRHELERIELLIRGHAGREYVGAAEAAAEMVRNLLARTRQLKVST